MDIKIYEDKMEKSLANLEDEYTPSVQEEQIREF